MKLDEKNQGGTFYKEVSGSAVPRLPVHDRGYALDSRLHRGAAPTNCTYN